MRCWAADVSVPNHGWEMPEKKAKVSTGEQQSVERIRVAIDEFQCLKVDHFITKIHS